MTQARRARTRALTSRAPQTSLRSLRKDDYAGRPPLGAPPRRSVPRTVFRLWTGIIREPCLRGFPPLALPRLALRPPLVMEADSDPRPPGRGYEPRAQAPHPAPLWLVSGDALGERDGTTIGEDKLLSIFRAAINRKAVYTC